MKILTASASIIWCIPGAVPPFRRKTLPHRKTRAVVDLIVDRVLDFERRGLKKEVLLVDNHADGPYLYLKYRDKDPERAAAIYRLLMMSGGNRSGMAFANVDNEGNVHPDQFTQHHILGNVRERAFGEIWSDTTLPLLGRAEKSQTFAGRALPGLQLAGNLQR